MKRRIFSSLLLLVVLFNVLSLVVFAEGAGDAVVAAETDLLLEEMKANMTDEATGKTKFDISKYPKSENGSPLIIGGYESGIFDELDPALYFYVYNPSEKEISQIKAGLRVKFILNGETVYNNFLLDQPAIELVNATIGDCSNRFYKAKIDLSSYASKYDPKECTEHVFTLDYTMFYYEGQSRPVKLDNEIDFTFGIDKTNKKLVCDVSNKEVDELEVGMTCYRHGSVDADLYTVNQINTAYFSVPDRYAEYFEDIYSIASTYKKKTTVPIMWGDFPSNYLDYFYCSQQNGTALDQGHFVEAETGVWKEPFEEPCIENCFSFDEIITFDFAGLDATYKVPRYYIQERFEEWQNDGSNKKLFVESEYCHTTRTIDQSFDSLSYLEQADFWKRVEDYGLLQALILSWNEEKFVVEEDYYDIPYIVLCDDTVRNDLKNLSAESFCDKYFIEISDYSQFKIYLNGHDNVYLYRYDISEYWSDTLLAGSTSGGEFKQSSTLKKTFGVCQTAYYDDFQVVNITFKNEDSYLSVAVTSEPQDFIGPGSVEDPSPKTDPLDWWAALMAKLEEFWAAIKRFMVIIAVVVVVVLVITVIGHFTRFPQQREQYFQKQSKK